MLAPLQSLPLVLLASCSLHLGSKVRYEETEKAEPISLDGFHTVSIVNRVGTVEIAGTEGKTLTIQSWTKVRAASEEKAKEFVKEIRVIRKASEKEEGVFLVEYIPPEKGFLGGDFEIQIDLKVTIPKIIALRAKNGVGDMQIENVKGNIVCGNGVGDLNVSDVEGDIQCKTGVGDLTLKNVEGALHLKTGVGSFNVRGSAKSLDASCGTGSGFASLHAVEGDVQMKTGVGNLTLQVPEAIDASADLSAGVGSLSSSFGLTKDKSITGGKMQGQIGKGGLQIKMTAGTGDVSLRKQ